MNPWYLFIIGLIVGWLAELLIDIFYWRKRRLCPEDTTLHIQAELDKALAANGRLEADLNGRNAKIADLEAKFANWRGELDGLNEASKGWGFGSILPNGDLALGGFLSGLRDRFAGFKADIDAKTSEIGDLNLNLSNKEVEMGSLQASLDAKDVELGNMRAELDGFDKEAGRLGLGSLFAGGGGLALGGFLSNLRNRFDGDKDAKVELEGQLGSLRGDLNTKDARIGELEAELGQLASLRGDLDVKTARIGELEADLNGCNAKLGSLEAELGELDAEMGNLGLGNVKAAGGGLALGGFLANLRNRFDGDGNAKAELEGQLLSLRGDLDTKDARIGELEAELGQLGSLRGDLDVKTARIGELEADLNGCNAKLGSLEAELGELDAEMSGLGLGSVKAAGGGFAVGGLMASLRNRMAGDADANGRIADLEAQLDLCQSSLAELRSRDVEYMGPRGLSMVWGLNSEASDKLEGKGIYTYSQLGATAPDDIDDALSLAHNYYPGMDNTGIHGSWVEQSRFAASGDWDGLFGYQQNNFDLHARRDDLKKMWGIGPKIEKVLNGKGIYLWAQLASVPADRITEILRDAGDRFNMSTGKLHESWPKQARLADMDQWDELKELTDKLSWSKVN